MEFKVWIIELKFLLSLYFFSSPVFIHTLIFLFFPHQLLSFEPLVLLLLHHLVVPYVSLPRCLILLPWVVALSFHPIALSCCFVTSSYYFELLLCYTASLRHVASLFLTTWFPLHLKYFLTPPFYCFTANKNKQKYRKWERRTNEDKSLKIAYSKKKLATTWKTIFVLKFLLCQR